MSKKNVLSTTDLIDIDQFDKVFNTWLDDIEHCKKFKIGDYLIVYSRDGDRGRTLHINSYGAPVKYKVVHQNRHGIPFIKTVNAKGEPQGSIFCMVNDHPSLEIRNRLQFELDPDYADSIILEDEYDPAVLHRDKKDIFKAVTAHNKACKIKTTSVIADVVPFLNTVRAGDTLWTSSLSYYLIQDVQTMSVGAWKAMSKNNYTRLRGDIKILTIVDKKGKVQTVNADFFHCKALYNDKPRSYNELKS